MNSLRNIDLNLLVIFEAIYSNGNISQAAHQLGLSQPTISNSLTRLRETLGDQLFVRAKHGVTPTPKATQMIVSVREALRIIQIGIAEGEKFDPAHTQRKFRIIVAEPMEQIILPALISDLPEGSGISFDYYSPLLQNVEESLITGVAELAVFLLPPKTQDLRTKVLCPLDIVGIVREGHPRLGNRSSITKKQIIGESHVVLNLEPGKIVNSDKLSMLQTPARRIVCRASSAGAIARIVGATDLFGMVPKLFAEYMAKSCGLKIFKLPMEMNTQNMFMIWHVRHSTDSAHIWLRNRIQALVKTASGFEPPD